MQNRNFGRFPFGKGAQNEGVGVILRDGVVSEVDAVVSGFFHVLYDVGVVVLYSRRSKSVKRKTRGRRWTAHVEGEIGTKALDELVVAFGSGRNNLVPRKLGQLNCVLSNRRATTINEELGVSHERMSSIASPMSHSPRFRVRVDWRPRAERAGGCWDHKARLPTYTAGYQSSRPPQRCTFPQG